MIYVFDLDGTICSTTNGNYETAEPYFDRIEKINKLFDQGHEITIYTARGMRTSSNNATKAYQKYYCLTSKQLADWNVKYHNLFLGKPAGDMYVDDKGINHEDYFGTIVYP